MKPNSPRRDRISALPDEVLHQILSFMGEIHHSIRTSILSKRWKYQWTFNPTLHFPLYCDASPSFRKPNRGYPTKPYGNCNMEAINKTLKQYQANQLQKLRIQIYETNKNVLVHEWFRFAIERKVKDLTVIAPRGDCFDPWFCIPRCLFQSTLRSLSLSYVTLNPLCFQLDGKYFDSLESITISYFQDLDGAFKTLVSKCRNLRSLSFTFHTENRFKDYALTKLSLSLPKLQHLYIGYGSMYPYIEIDAPNLRTIRVEDDFFCNLHLQNYAPYMQEATINFRDISFNKILGEGRELPYQDLHEWGSNMESMRNIRCLQLGGDVFNLIYREYERRRFVLKNLKKFSLSHVKC